MFIGIDEQIQPGPGRVATPVVVPGAKSSRTSPDVASAKEVSGLRIGKLLVADHDSAEQRYCPVFFLLLGRQQTACARRNRTQIQPNPFSMVWTASTRFPHGWAADSLRIA